MRVLTAVLTTSPGVEVVGEAVDGRAAVALARRLRPDGCLVDVRMPLLDGMRAARQLAGPDVADPIPVVAITTVIPVVVITTVDTDDHAYGALRAGVRGSCSRGPHRSSSSRRWRRPCAATPSSSPL